MICVYGVYEKQQRTIAFVQGLFLFPPPVCMG